MFMPNFQEETRPGVVGEPLVDARSTQPLASSESECMNEGVA